MYILSLDFQTHCLSMIEMYKMFIFGWTDPFDTYVERDIRSPRRHLADRMALVTASRLFLLEHWPMDGTVRGRRWGWGPLWACFRYDSRSGWLEDGVLPPAWNQQTYKFRRYWDTASSCSGLWDTLSALWEFLRLPSSCISEYSSSSSSSMMSERSEPRLLSVWYSSLWL